MRELFRKYLDNNCSPDEVKRLLAYFNIDENETILRRLITEWLEENDEYEKDRWQTNFYRASGLIKKEVNINIFNGSPVVSYTGAIPKKKLFFHLFFIDGVFSSTNNNYH